jgi:hypothetical protein
VLVVPASRPGRELPRTETAAVRLAPLSHEQIAALVASLGSLPDAPWCHGFPRRLETATGGSPLLVLETLHHALDSGALERAGGRWHCPDEAALQALLEAGSALRRRIEHLERPLGWLLVILSLAGAPQGLEVLARASGYGHDRTLEILNDLERRGLAARQGDLWSVGHDEIADRTRDGADPRQRTTAQAALGRALLETGDRGSLRPAAQHLAAAGGGHELAVAAAAWVRGARARGDRRPVRTLLEELLGSPTDAEMVSLARALPLTLRTSASPWWVAAAVATAAVVALLAVIPPWSRDEPGITLAVWTKDPDGRWRMKSHDLTARDIAAGVVRLSSFRRTGLVSPDRPEGLIRPGAPGSVAVTRAYQDSGGLDVAITRGNQGREQRVTYHRGDDYARAWSPDGRYLLIATDRWSDQSRSDLAILEPDRPEVPPRRLTSRADARDETGLWSPDGTRIAFRRASFGNPSHQLCVVTVDAVSERCIDLPGHANQALVGWINAVEAAAVFRDPAGVARLYAVNTVSGRFRELAEGAAPVQSRASGWIACFCRRTVDEPYQALVFAAARPERAVRVDYDSTPPGIEVFASRRPRSYLDRLTIEGAAEPVPADGILRLTLEGWDAAGTPAEPVAVRWTSSDTAVATVDSAGTLRPRREGRLTVRATAGGWRTTTTEIAIGPPETRTLVREDWRSGITHTWVPFGDPAPFVAPSDRGPVLVPNGDSTFLSGVYLRRSMPLRAGVGMELDLSTPLTELVWQNVMVMVWAVNASDLAGGDVAQGGPQMFGEQWRECSVHYPSTESASGRQTLMIGTGIPRTIAVPEGMARGRWTRLRLQLFPDGRCGVAIDGAARAIVDRRARLGDSAVVLIYAYSHHTRIAVGPLEVWTGVRRDVDWDTVQ